MSDNYNGPAMADEIIKLRAQLVALEHQRDTWGNEFNAVVIMKEQLAEAQKAAASREETNHQVTTALVQAESKLEMYEKDVVRLVREKATLESKLDSDRSMLTLVYTAGADGEGMKSCCDGKHFSTTLLAGDRVYRLSYADTEAFDKLSGKQPVPDTNLCERYRTALEEAQKEVTDWKAKYIDARKSGYQEGLEEMQTKLALAESDVSIKHKYRADVLERERDALHAKLDCAEKAVEALQRGLMLRDERLAFAREWIENSNHTGESIRRALAKLDGPESARPDTTHASKYCVCKACSIAARAGEEREP